MNWALRSAERGDMVRVKCGSIYHYGVFISEDEIIQFGLAPSQRQGVKACDIEVCTSDVDVFLGGGFLEVAVLDKKERKKRRKVEDTVRMARERLGEKGYHILYNNCEHFAYECVMGERYCSQTDTVRSLFKSLPILDLYTAILPTDAAVGHLSVKAIDEELEAIADGEEKKRRYYEWKLLEYGLERSLGLKLGKIKPYLNEGGRWCSDSCFFAFSAGKRDGVIAVAVSRAEVGLKLSESYNENAAEIEGSRSGTLLDSTVYTLTSSTPEALRLYENVELT